MAYKILIVDDSAVTRAVLKKTIGMIDCPVDTILEAANGKQALEVIEESNVDIVLADLNMPEMNGIEMAGHILGNNEIKMVPAVVIITTERNDARIQDLRARGIKGYVHKPFTPEQIKSVLLNVLGVEVSDDYTENS